MDCGRRSKLIYRQRQYVIDEIAGWTSMGVFRELVGEEILKEAARKTQEGNHHEYEGTSGSQGFQGSIFEGLESSDRALQPTEEVLKIEDKDGMERILGLFRDRVWY